MIHLLLLWYCWSKNSATRLVRNIRNPKMSKFNSFCIFSNALILHSKLILLLGISSTRKPIMQFRKKFDVPGHIWSHQECWFQFLLFFWASQKLSMSKIKITHWFLQEKKSFRRNLTGQVQLSYFGIKFLQEMKLA